MKWKTTFIFAFVAQIIGIIGFSFVMPFLPFFIKDLGVEDVGSQALWAGVALSSAGITFAIFAPIWGVYADKYGRKFMVCRAMFGGAMALLLMSFVQTVPQLVFCRILQGAFSGTIAANIALVASVVPHRRSGFTLGMMQTAVFIGNAVGPFFGGLAADAFGYRVSFRMGAILTLLGGLMVYFGTRDNFTRPSIEESAEIPGFTKILLLPGFLISVAVMFGVRLSNSMSSPSFPLIVRDIVHSSTNLNSITGGIVAVAAIAGAISAGVLGHAGDRMGRKRILVGCCIGAAISSVGHYFAQTLPALVAMRILFGFTVAGMLPAANAMIHSIVDQRSIGKAYGLATSISMLGSAAGPTAGGFIAMQAGLRFPFMATAMAQIFMGLMIVMLLHDKRERDETPSIPILQKDHINK